MPKIILCENCAYCVENPVDESLNRSNSCRYNPPSAVLLPTQQGPQILTVYPSVSVGMGCAQGLTVMTVVK